MTNEHLFQMRVSKDFLAVLDKWRGKQVPIPSRAEAIRLLTALGIKAK